MGSGAAAPAGGRRIGTAGPFRFLFGHEKEGLSRQAAVCQITEYRQGFSRNHWPLFAADLFRKQRFALLFAWRWRAIGRHSRPGKKSYPHLLAVTGGGFGVSFWCEEESCSRVTVAAPFPVLIRYPILAKNLLSSCELSVNFAENMRFVKIIRCYE